MYSDHSENMYFFYFFVICFLYNECFQCLWNIKIGLRLLFCQIFSWWIHFYQYYFRFWQNWFSGLELSERILKNLLRYKWNAQVKQCNYEINSFNERCPFMISFYAYQILIILLEQQNKYITISINMLERGIM